MPLPAETQVEPFSPGEFMVNHKILTLGMLVAGLEFEGVPVLESVLRVARVMTYFGGQ